MRGESFAHATDEVAGFVNVTDQYTIIHPDPKK